MAKEEELIIEENLAPPPPAETPSEPGAKKIPIDIFSDKIPNKEVLPLDGQVKTKEYAALPNDQPGAEPGGAIPPATPGAPASPAAGPVNPEEIKNQADQTVDLILRGYEKAHALGRYLGKVDPNELAGMHASGKIDLEQELPIGNKKISVGAFFTEYNTELETNISVSDDFVKNIKPPLTRICIKRNWLLSDELYVGSILAEDLTTKVSLLIGLKKSANLILAACISIQTKKAEKESKSDTSEKPAEQTTQVPPADPNDTWKESES